MSYQKFAFLYDQLMTDAPYEEWVSFVLRKINKNLNNSHKLLDVGCGTGNIAIPLSKHGLHVTAVDLSEEMLYVAREKSLQENVTVHFFQQDMRELEGLGLFDTVISFCDTINYLLDESEVKLTFQNVNNHLKQNGLFIFDIHSLHKINEGFIGKSFAYNGEDISYIWESFQGEMSNSVEHDLSFFVLNQDGLYERFDEIHEQRAYPLSFLKDVLAESGFEILSITSDFSSETFNEEGERWFFVCKKV